MKRGQKPQPTALKALRGNPGRRPLNTNEPEHEPMGDDFDDVPTEIATDIKAAAEWQRLAPRLKHARQITKAERGALIALCREWSRYLQACEKVTDLGMVVKAPSGYPIVNPYLGISNRALSQCSKLWAELGLTPSSRSRVQMAVGQAGDEDSFSEFDEPLQELAIDDDTTH